MGRSLKPQGPARPVANTLSTVLQRMVVASGRVRYKTGSMRPRDPGVGARVNEFADADEVLELVRDVVRKEYHKLTVWHAGALAPAEHLRIDKPEDFITDGVDALFAQVDSLGLPPDEAMALLLGNDRLGSARYLISKRERVIRLVEGQLSGASEMMMHTADDNYETIYELYMLGAMVRYTRNFINRSGFEHGERLELRKNFALTILPFLRGIMPVFQAVAPTVSGKRLAASSDVLLFGLLGALSLQVKALSTVSAAARGRLIPVRSGGLITDFTGPEMLEQVARDGLRARHNLRRVADGDGNTHDLMAVTVAILDSTHIMNDVIELVAKAFFDTGLDIIDPMVHIKAPPYRREMIRDILGTSVVRRSDDIDADELSRRGAVEHYMETELPILQTRSNEELADPDVVQAIGQQLSVRYLGDHQEQELLDTLAEFQVIPPGLVPEGW